MFFLTFSRPIYYLRSTSPAPSLLVTFRCNPDPGSHIEGMHYVRSPPGRPAGMHFVHHYNNDRFLYQGYCKKWKMTRVWFLASLPWTRGWCTSRSDDAARWKARWTTTDDALNVYFSQPLSLLIVYCTLGARVWKATYYTMKCTINSSEASF